MMEVMMRPPESVHVAPVYVPGMKPLCSAAFAVLSTSVIKIASTTVGFRQSFPDMLFFYDCTYPPVAAFCQSENTCMMLRASCKFSFFLSWRGL